QTLTPVIETLGQAARLFGDVLATILPSGQEMKELLQPINDLLADLRDALAPIAHLLHDVLVVGFKALGAVLRIVLIPFQLLAKLLTSIFGGGEGLKDSTGAAARNIRFEDPMSAVKSVYAAAFRASYGAQKEKTALDVIGEKIDAATDWLSKIFGTLGSIF